MWAVSIHRMRGNKKENDRKKERKTEINKERTKERKKERNKKKNERNNERKKERKNERTKQQKNTKEKKLDKNYRTLSCGTEHALALTLALTNCTCDRILTCFVNYIEQLTPVYEWHDHIQMLVVLHGAQ